jgi:hypothetical protein
MPATILKDQAIWFDAYNLTTRLNSIELDYGVETEDNTTFGDDTRSNLGGLKTVTAQIEGFYDANPYDAALFNDLGIANKVISFGTSATLGSVAFTFKSLLGDYSPIKGKVGDILGFSAGAKATKGSLIRGVFMENAVAVTGSSGASVASFPLLFSTVSGTTVSGTPRQLGAVGSTQKLYAALHVTRITPGTSLSINLKSDDNSGFTSPVSVGGFPLMNAIGSYWLEIPGPFTDTWWRGDCLINGEADYVLILGIQ